MKHIKFFILLSLVSFSIKTNALESDESEFDVHDLQNSSSEDSLNSYCLVDKKQTSFDDNKLDWNVLENIDLQEFQHKIVSHQNYIEGNVKYLEQIVLDSNNNIHSYNKRNFHDTYEAIWLYVKTISEDLEILKKSNIEYSNFKNVAFIFNYSNRLITLIYKFRLNQHPAFEDTLMVLKKTVNHIRQDIIKLALNKNKKALLFLKENIILGSDYKTINKYLEANT